MPKEEKEMTSINAARSKYDGFYLEYYFKNRVIQLTRDVCK